MRAEAQLALRWAARGEVPAHAKGILSWSSGCGADQAKAVVPGLDAGHGVAEHHPPLAHSGGSLRGHGARSGVLESSLCAETEDETHGLRYVTIPGRVLKHSISGKTLPCWAPQRTLPGDLRPSADPE